MTPQRLTAAASRRRQAGVTLVELMVSMVLGLIVTAGIIQVFLGNRATYAFNESLSWIQENARFSLDHVANHTRMAGHLGCLADVPVFNNLGGAPNPFRDDLATGLQGYDFNGTGAGEAFAAAAMNPAPLGTANAWTPSLPAVLTFPARVIPGSDVLVVRYISGPSTPVIAPFGTLTQLRVPTPHTFSAGQVLVVTDCQKASIFQLTGTSGGGALLNHALAGGFTPGNGIGVWPIQQSYGLGSEVSTLETIAFYVGRGTNNAPSLFQLRLQPTSATVSQLVPEELVQGIDTMQVRYGVDSDADRQVDVWQSADAMALADWGTVLSVEITLLARADEEYGTETDTTVYNAGGTQFDPTDDRRLRHVFTTIVGLRNRLP